MAPGERAALEGVLALVRPSLSIEIGTCKGGSLGPIAAYSDEVRAFDLERHPEVTVERFPNVTFHLGDSHDLLPKVLAELAAAGRNVDFAFVDGDHTAAGVRRDVEDLLASPAAARTVILLHDTLNARVRAGLEDVRYETFERVGLVDLDFVPGRVDRQGPLADELWYGLGVVVTGAELPSAAWPRAYAVPEVYEAFAQSAGNGAEWRAGAEQVRELEREVATQREVVRLMQQSWSWRVTKPLRWVRSLRRGGSA
jgi:Methyltransferase domain